MIESYIQDAMLMMSKAVKTQTPATTKTPLATVFNGDRSPLKPCDRNDKREVCKRPPKSDDETKDDLSVSEIALLRVPSSWFRSFFWRHQPKG